mgnify:CR=1 FL=1
MSYKNYCVVSKEVLHNRNISLEAKGIYALMMSVDKDNFNVKELYDLSKEKINVIDYKTDILIAFDQATLDDYINELDELEKLGYVTLEK